MRDEMVPRALPAQVAGTEARTEEVRGLWALLPVHQHQPGGGFAFIGHHSCINDFSNPPFTGLFSGPTILTGNHLISTYAQGK